MAPGRLAAKRSRPEIEDLLTCRATGRQVVHVPVALGRGGSHRLLAERLCGAGRRLMEEDLGLRVKDVEFDRRAVIVREGQGFKQAVAALPATTPASRPPRAREPEPCFALSCLAPLATPATPCRPTPS